MTTNIGKFKKTIIDMFKKVESWVPRDSELEKNKMLIETAMSANPRGAIEMYMDGMEKFADHIMQENDQFFLNCNEEELVESDYVQLSRKLKQLWVTLDAGQQATLKKYSKLLLNIGTIVTKNEEIRVIINKYRDPQNPMRF